MGCIGVNKMDCDTAAYKQGRYDEIANEMKSMLVKVGWKKDFIEKNTPVLPISGWMGDNLLKKSDNMAWWKGQDIEYGKETIHLTPFTMSWTSFAVCRSARSAPPCACPSVESTKSRVSATCWRVVWSRVWSSRARRWSSCQRTPPPTLARERSSRWRCTTSAWILPIQATTWV